MKRFRKIAAAVCLLIGMTSALPVSAELLPEELDAQWNAEAFIVAADDACFVAFDGMLFSKDLKILYRCPTGKTGAVSLPANPDLLVADGAFAGCSGVTALADPYGNTDVIRQVILQFKAEGITLPDVFLYDMDSDTAALCEEQGCAAYEFGDVNLDHTINIMDVITINKNLLGGCTLGSSGRLAADRDQNGEVNAADALCVMKHIVGLPEALPDVVPAIYEVPADLRYIQTQLAVKLLQETVQQDADTLVSPLSVELALAMTANGAKGQTLSEMEQVLGGLPIADLNEMLRSYVASLPSGEQYKLSIADSVWFRDDENRLTVNADFLHKARTYYNAEVRAEPFTQETCDIINAWISEHTDGLIDHVLDEIDPETVMFLVNALVFDAEWEEPYGEYFTWDEPFTAWDGTQHKVPMMHSEESVYLEDERATGFVKYYADRKYAFAALLPNEDMTLTEYVASLDARQLIDTLDSRTELYVVHATLPKFESGYFDSLADALKHMGMQAAFRPTQADFTDMAVSSNGNIYIGDVLHKTFIKVDERGTKAGAATVVIANDECAPMQEYVRYVSLDRPFVYMILDCEDNVPVFIGTVTDIA